MLDNQTNWSPHFVAFLYPKLCFRNVAMGQPMGNPSDVTGIQGKFCVNNVEFWELRVKNVFCVYR